MMRLYRPGLPQEMNATERMINSLIVLCFRYRISITVLSDSVAELWARENLSI